MICGSLNLNLYSLNWVRWQQMFVEAGFGEGHLQRGWFGQKKVYQQRGQTLPDDLSASLTKDIVASLCICWTYI